MASQSQVQHVDIEVPLLRLEVICTPTLVKDERIFNGSMFFLNPFYEWFCHAIIVMYMYIDCIMIPINNYCGICGIT